MALATQCPHCHTTFKVAHDQLKLRSGLVRCGSCREIFNGIEHLVHPETVPPAAAPTQPAQDLIAQLPLAVDLTSTPASSAPAPEAKPDPAPQAIPAPSPPLQPTLFELPEAPLAESAPDARGAPADEKMTDIPPDIDRIVAAELAQAIDTDVPLSPAPGPAQTMGAAAPSADHWVIEEPTQAAEVAVDTTPVAERDDAPAMMPPQSASPPPQQANITELASQDGAASALSFTAPAAPTDTYKPLAEIRAAAGRDNVAEADAEENADHQSIDEDEPGFVIQGRRRQRRARIARLLMSIGSVVLLLTLLGQGAYGFRHLLAAWFPQTKPALVQMCELLACDIRLPAQIDMVSIESHELQAQAPDKNIFGLSLLLRNRSAVNQAWPNIELTLNDSSEKPLVRKVLTPKDYVTTTQDLPKGLLSQSEYPVKLNFALAQVKASGYRVYLFYP